MALGKVAFVTLLGVFAATAPVFAGEQVYRPTNPTFGGNALNGS